MNDHILGIPIADVSLIQLEENLQQWVLDKAKAYNLKWLLAHADDGVTWGRIDQGVLTVSSALDPTYAPLLRRATLQQLRLFGTAGEFYLWQADDGWRGRFLDGRTDEAQETFSTHYLLWGDREEARANGFVLLADGTEGLRHIPPLPADEEFVAGEQYLALSVRHYVAYDDDGQAYIGASRLVEIKTIARK